MKIAAYVPYFVGIFCAMITLFLLGSSMTLAALRVITPMQLGELMMFVFFYGAISHVGISTWLKHK